MGQMFLGGCYSGGAGVTRDLAKAVYWLRKSADQGYEPARAMLKKMGLLDSVAEIKMIALHQLGRLFENAELMKYLN